MYWWAHVCRYPTPGCSNTSFYGVTLYSNSERDCGNVNYSDYRRCNNRRGPLNAIPLTKSSRYIRLCRDCASSYREIEKFTRPLREFRCAEYNHLLILYENDFKIHVEKGHPHINRVDYQSAFTVVIRDLRSQYVPLYRRALRIEQLPEHIEETESTVSTATDDQPSILSTDYEDDTYSESDFSSIVPPPTNRVGLTYNAREHGSRRSPNPAASSSISMYDRSPYQSTSAIVSTLELAECRGRAESTETLPSISTCSGYTEDKEDNELSLVRTPPARHRR